MTQCAPSMRPSYSSGQQSIQRRVWTGTADKRTNLVFNILVFPVCQSHITVVMVAMAMVAAAAVAGGGSTCQRPGYGPVSSNLK